MTKRMLIDAAHPEETRVVVVDGSRIEELDFESAARKQLRGNIYLAKVTRVEPSLQAAFIEYGGNRHGFLAFNEIHPDYYQIPMADREALMREVEAEHDDDDQEDEDAEDEDGGDEAEQAFQRRQRRLMRRYKIQDVIRRRQIMLVQVVKEERGNKGAALTTYLSLAGRYGVLMPNTGRGGGISRKIVSSTDRRRLKSIVSGLDVPNGMGLIVRTAGAKRTNQEISRDYEYLLRLWENIRETTLKSIAPSLIYEEEDLVKRAIRDMYDKDLDGIVVEGEAGYRDARQFMRMIMPGQSSKITPYREKTPLFTAFKIEDQLQQMHQPVVPLKSGGYLVINQTEALVAVDVNSGRATRERNVEATAFRTNIEAAEETARQLRLRDLAGLIVIDFIDMDESKNNRAVEKVLKDCLSDDRARVQMGKISPFGLMEISRQRRRAGVLEGATHVCEHCQGTGRIRNVESSALAALRAIELEAVRSGAGAITVRLPTAVALYLLNEKRAYIARVEQMHMLEVNIVTDAELARDDVQVERRAAHPGDEEGAAARFASRRLAPALLPIADEEEDDFVDEVEDEEDEEPILEEADETEALDGSEPRTGVADDGHARSGRGRRRRRRGGRRDEGETVEVLVVETDADTDADAEETEEPDEVSPGAEFDEADQRRPRRRRGRRGGRRLREEGRPDDPYAWTHAHGGKDTPHPSDDPYAWRDPHGADVGGGERSGGEDVAQATHAPLSPPSAEPTRPARGPQLAADEDPYVWAESGTPDTNVSAEPGESRGRPRRRRGGRGRERQDRGEETVLATESGIATAAESVSEEAYAEGVWSDAPPSVLPARGEPPAEDVQTDAAPIQGAELASHAEATVEPPPAPSAEDATAETPNLAPAAEPASPPEPDPAEITGQTAAPRRGWWRRKA